jgi:hypothetical protein
VVTPRCSLATSGPHACAQRGTPRCLPPLVSRVRAGRRGSSGSCVPPLLLFGLLVLCSSYSARAICRGCRHCGQR